MKTIFKYIFSVALGSIMLTSCDLDTIPTTYVDAGSVFGKTGDAEKVLNGGWNYLMETFNSYANPGYGAMLRANDAMGSDVVLNSKYGFRTHNEFSAIYGKGGTNTLSWLLAYRVINDCNGVLDNIDAAEGTQADRNRIKGQALALRGFLYLHLASCYSFAIDKDPDAVCAPVYTQSTDETIAAEGKPASSVSEVYAQSINDLEEALELIPETYVRDAKHKIDNEVVLGILSRACLYARQWEKAKTYSDKLLTKNNYLMTESEYKAGFNSVDNKEWIWGHAQTNDQSNASYQFHYLDTTTKGSYYYSFHVVNVRVIPCVHGDLLPAEQHQQLPLLFSSIKIALRAVPICVHRCSSVYPLCGQNFKLSARCRLRAFPLRRGPSVPFWRSRARGRRGPSLQPRPPRKRRQSQGRPSAKWQTPCAALPAKLAAFLRSGLRFPRPSAARRIHRRRCGSSSRSGRRLF